MKILTTITLTAAALATLTAPASAQEVAVSAKPRPSITADPIIALPIGDAENAAGVGFGASATVLVPINGQLEATGRLGFLYHLEKNDLTWMFVPIYGGARFRLSPTPSSLYVAGEMGITWGRASGDTPFGTISDSDTEIGGMLGAGWVTPAVDLRAGFFFPDIGELDDALAIMASASFTIAEL